MTATPPPSGPAAGSSGSRPRPPADEDTQRYYSRFLGWLVLAIILGYAGLQFPLPWRAVTVLASAAGLVGAVVLFIHCVRRRLSALMLIGAVMVSLCCGTFLVSAGAQLVFWEASAEFESCLNSAVTQRATDQCLDDYEQNIVSSIPGMP
ncbi:hypothetical protein [Nesterenkonia sp.]|uniref:hypothetical protein n=1 Tax=Nesterenkonia sp. TaxID=704201 RepID=UPI0026104587|nr:hypothetical protein [Nesterenkonia sp.]